jgi:hypothetical protein
MSKTSAIQSFSGQSASELPQHDLALCGQKQRRPQSFAMAIFVVLPTPTDNLSPLYAGAG